MDFLGYALENTVWIKNMDIISNPPSNIYIYINLFLIVFCFNPFVFSIFFSQFLLFRFFFFFLFFLIFFLMMPVKILPERE